MCSVIWTWHVKCALLVLAFAGKNKNKRLKRGTCQPDVYIILEFNLIKRVRGSPQSLEFNVTEKRKDSQFSAIDLHSNR